jgi:hypothetical protein
MMMITCRILWMPTAGGGGRLVVLGGATVVVERW